MAQATDAGARIRRRRRELGLTQAELAARIGVASITVMRWELGRYFPDWRHIGPLEAELGIRVADDEPPDPFEEALLALGIARADVRHVTAKYQPTPVIRQSA